MPLSVQKTNFSGLVKKNLRCINHLSYGVVHSINGPADHPGEEVAGVAELVRQTVDLKVQPSLNFGATGFSNSVLPDGKI